ncbi:MAG: hypothetical protein ABIO79_17500 [Ferruginibacter sp.]
MKKKLSSTFIFVFVSIIFMASCNTPRYIYSPSAHNVPVLTKKGDSKIGAVYSTNAVEQETKDGVEIDNRTRGFDLQGAVAVTNNFAIQASHFYRWEKTEGGPDSITIRYKRNLTEVGFGYYMPINEKKMLFSRYLPGQTWAGLALLIPVSLGMIITRQTLQRSTCNQLFFLKVKEVSLQPLP